MMKNITEKGLTPYNGITGNDTTLEGCVINDTENGKRLTYGESHPVGEGGLFLAQDGQHLLPVWKLLQVQLYHLGEEDMEKCQNLFFF